MNVHESHDLPPVILFDLEDGQNVAVVHKNENFESNIKKAIEEEFLTDVLEIEIDNKFITALCCDDECPDNAIEYERHFKTEWTYIYK